MTDPRPAPQLDRQPPTEIGDASIVEGSDVARALGSDLDGGLSSADAAGRLARAIAAAATALARVDALCFTGGIGEHSAASRAAIVARLAALRVPQALAATDGDSIVAVGPPAVIMVAAREDRVIAEEVDSLLR